MRPAQRRDLLDLAVGDLGEATRRGRRCARSRRGRGPRWRAGASCALPTSCRLGDGDLVDAVELVDADVDALARARSAGSCRRSRGGSAARGGRGRRARRAARAPGGRSRTAPRSRRARCGRCRGRRRRSRPCVRRRRSRCGARGRPACSGGGRGRRGRRRCRGRRAGPRASSRSLEQVAAGGAARIAPRRWMPTIASGVRRRAFFSTISCAMRTSVRRMSSPSRTTFSAVQFSALPGLTGPG